MAASTPVWQTEQKIPVRNIWLLMFYASEFRHHNLGNTGSEKPPEELPDLVAEILCHTVERRLKQNLSQGYVNQEAVRSRVRGQVDVLKSESLGLFQRGLVACRYHELTINTPRNRYVRGALRHLAGLVGSFFIRQRCRALSVRLEQAGVLGQPPSGREMVNERYGRHDQHDRPMVTAAKLAYQLKIPTEENDRLILLRASHDEQWLRRVFEKGVVGFYEVALKSAGWSVQSGTKQSWPVVSGSENFSRILPEMFTDAVLEHRLTKRRIIVDTKFANILTPNAYGQGKLKSSYLYQMYAYLRTQEDSADPVSFSTEGLLLHPSLDENIDEEAIIQDHRIRVATVDLAADTSEVRRQLLHRIEKSSEYLTALI